MPASLGDFTLNVTVVELFAFMLTLSCRVIDQPSGIVDARFRTTGMGFRLLILAVYVTSVPGSAILLAGCTRISIVFFVKTVICSVTLFVFGSCAYDIADNEINSIAMNNAATMGKDNAFFPPA